MKSRGLDRSVIEEAIKRSERGRKAEAVCETIRAAFAGVVLGNGVGLTEAAIGHDSNADDDVLAALREKDEQLDWRKISYADLNLHHCSLSFFDADGMRFHLPAFLIADLQGESYDDISFRLTDKSGFYFDKFSILTEVQRAAVRDFLRFIGTDEEHGYYGDPEITGALEGYWKETAAD